MTRFAPILLALTLGCSPAYTMDTSAGNLTVTKMVDQLDEPWALGFLPDGGMLITERAGRLWHVADGERREISGLPEVAARGQGGLTDVLIPRDFAQDRTLFLTFSKPQARGAGTAIFRASLAPGADRLSDARVIFELEPGSSGGRHFGSRLVEGTDGYLYATIGERGDRPSAQDLSRQNGSVIRIARDGSVPEDNPFVGNDGAQPEIWSYGHRNPQGAALDAEGNLWVNEHGARGGDEVNRIRRGANYGWPVISYGTHYSGAKIGEGTQKEGMEQPAHYWDPSIAPSGMMIYQGDMFPEWRGDMFVGSLKFNMISRLSGEDVTEVERLESPETQRVRHIVEGPDGAIWFLSEGRGAAFRITPN
jgi:glucose/arabinose dehydrogenase